MSKKNKKQAATSAPVVEVAPVVVATPAPVVEPTKPDLNLNVPSRDELSGVVHCPRKQAIVEYCVKGEAKPFELGDQVKYLGQVRKNYGRTGILVGRRDNFGFYIKWDDNGAESSTIPGALLLIKRATKAEATDEAKAS